MMFYYGAFYSTLKLSIQNINLIYNFLRDVFVSHIKYMQGDCIFPFLPLLLDFYDCDTCFGTRFPGISNRAKTYLHINNWHRCSPSWMRLNILTARTCQQQKLMPNIHPLLSPLPIQHSITNQKCAAFCCGCNKSRLEERKKEGEKEKKPKRGIQNNLLKAKAV